MNRLAIITGFLGRQGNRFLQYQDARSSEERLRLAAQVKGCDGVELGYPEDFENPTRTRELLDELNLAVSGLNFRSRRPGKWMRGAWSSESKEERREAVDDFKRAMDWAAELGVRRVSNCPLNDGSDYLFELDYIRAYDNAAECFAEIAAHDRNMHVCIEYKETEPRVRCLLGNVGEAIAFCDLVGAANLGVTVDVGHALMCGERPAQAAALAAKAKRLFYVHLNDNDGRFDWDVMPGAYRMWDTVELFYYLKRLGYDNDWYTFDVTPKEFDPVETFRVTFELTRKLESIADKIDEAQIQGILASRNPNRSLPYLYSLI